MILSGSCPGMKPHRPARRSQCRNAGTTSTATHSIRHIHSIHSHIHTQTMMNLTAEEVSDSRWRQSQPQQSLSGSGPIVRRRSSVMSLSSLPNMPISAKDIESRGKRRALNQEAKEASVHESHKYDVRDSAEHIIGDDELWREFKAKLDGCGHLTNVATHELLCEFLIQSKCYKREEMERMSSSSSRPRTRAQRPSVFSASTTAGGGGGLLGHFLNKTISITNAAAGLVPLENEMTDADEIVGVSSTPSNLQIRRQSSLLSLSGFSVHSVPVQQGTAGATIFSAQASAITDTTTNLAALASTSPATAATTSVPTAQDLLNRAQTAAEAGTTALGEQFRRLSASSRRSSVSSLGSSGLYGGRRPSANFLTFVDILSEEDTDDEYESSDDIGDKKQEASSRHPAEVANVELQDISSRNKSSESSQVIDYGYNMHYEDIDDEDKSPCNSTSSTTEDQHDHTSSSTLICGWGDESKQEMTSSALRLDDPSLKLQGPRAA